MISQAIYLKPVIEDVCSKKSVVALYKTHPLKLKREEWIILEELSPLLGVCMAAHFIFHFISYFHLTGIPQHIHRDAECRNSPHQHGHSTH